MKKIPKSIALIIYQVVKKKKKKSSTQKKNPLPKKVLVFIYCYHCYLL